MQIIMFEGSVQITMFEGYAENQIPAAIIQCII
jgi:hypothetical protein